MMYSIFIKRKVTVTFIFFFKCSKKCGSKFSKSRNFIIVGLIEQHFVFGNRFQQFVLPRFQHRSLMPRCLVFKSSHRIVQAFTCKMYFRKQNFLLCSSRCVVVLVTKSGQSDQLKQQRQLCRTTILYGQLSIIISALTKQSLRF